ncbi:MAG: CHAT domain-containing protein [Planctomycetota bacterium]|nr:CHAT domain-containing protein [Planctomycetota bacterium]
MPRLVVVALLSLLAVGPATADEKKPATKAKPLTVEQAVQAVLDAVTAKDEEALKALAGKDAPDPWLIADALWFRGEGAAAAAFVGTAEGPLTKGLAAYVKRSLDKPKETASRAAVTQAESAMRGRKHAEAVAIYGKSDTNIESVQGILLRNAASMGLYRLRRVGEGAQLMRETAQAAEKIGWLSKSLRQYRLAAIMFSHAAQIEASHAMFEKRLALAERLQLPAAVATALSELGASHGQRGNYAKARAMQERALPLLGKLGLERDMATLHRQLGGTCAQLGEFETARTHFEKARDLYTRVNDQVGLTRALTNLGIVLHQMGDYRQALRAQEAVLRRAGKSPELQATILVNMGNAYRGLGKYARALRTMKRALKLAEESRRPNLVASIHTSVGGIEHALGNYPAALDHMERSVRMLRAQGDKPGEAGALTRLGVVLISLGEHERAIAVQQQALQMHLASGNRSEIAETRTAIGQAYDQLGEEDAAREELTAALKLAEEIGRPYGIAKALNRLGGLQARIGEGEQALAAHQRAFSIYEKLGDRQGTLSTTAYLATAQEVVGDHDAALETLERGAREARRLRAPAVIVLLLQSAARIHLRRGDADEALSICRTALPQVETLLGGLDEASAASTRESYLPLFEVGTLAAMRVGEISEALVFLESGRAGALLESLQIRRSTMDDIPEALRDEEQEAKRALAQARLAFERAQKRRNLKKTRAASAALDTALEQVRSIAGRIQREAKRQAGLFYPRAATLEEIQGHLEKSQALVLYGLCMGEALAFVLTPDDARMVALGSAKAVYEACAALDLRGPDAEPAEALAALRKLLVDPLKLPGEITQILVSPEGPICYLPLSMVFEHPVAIAASGTTHVLLREEGRDEGTGVLALGDPVYAPAEARTDGAPGVYQRAGRLTPLPATRIEVERIGTTKLLGKDANERLLRERVGTVERWRAIHLACHGLIDLERPTLSSLALTREGENDGFLTALEVLRMRLPADLAVLSACETGTGRIVKGEGIVGLTRSFMYAGAQRVLCSLWKVDDAATQALMIKFYELWNPKPAIAKKGLGAAAALKKAQEYVRDFKDENGKQPWKHPYYWAAWVLWGLPE